MIGIFWPQPNAGSVIEPKSSPLWLFLWPDQHQAHYIHSANNSNFTQSFQLLCRQRQWFFPVPAATSIWRSFVTMCAAVSFFLARFFLLSSSILSYRLVQKKPVRSLSHLNPLLNFAASHGLVTFWSIWFVLQYFSISAFTSTASLARFLIAAKLSCS